MLGGELRVDSELGQGSCFTLTLPKVFAPAERPSATAAAPTPTAITRLPCPSRRPPRRSLDTSKCPHFPTIAITSTASGGCS